MKRLGSCYTSLASFSTPFIPLILGLFALRFYQQNTAPSVATIFDDSLEFPLVVHRLAIAHPTGYPLYTLLGKLFSLFNPENVAYQVNLMSAVFGALTVALTHQVGLSLQNHHRPQWSYSFAHQASAMSSALLFGVGSTFFSQATIAEVYTLNAFFVASILYLTLQHRWLLLATCVGFSLTHHITIVLLLPAVISYIWLTVRTPQKTQPQRSEFPSLWLLMPAFTIPLLLYLYLPWRGHIGSLDGTYQPTWRGFLQHITGGGYSTFLLENPFGHERTFSFYGTLLWSELNGWGIGLAIAGLLQLIWRRQGRLLTLTGGSCLLYLGFNLFYAVSDIRVFFIPVFLFGTLWAGLAVGQILTLIWPRQPFVAVVLAAALLLFIVSQPRGQSRADDWAVHDYGRDILAQSLPEQAVIVGILGEMTLVRFFQETANLRPDIQTIAADLEAERLATIENLWTENPSRPVYLTRELLAATGRWSFSAVGPLIRVYPEPQPQQPPPDPTIAIQQALDLPLSPAISLVHYAITRVETHDAIAPLRFTLTWRVDQPLQTDYKISARLLNEAGEVIAVVDKTPVHFAYPTAAWRAGEFIVDVYDLTIAPETPAGNHTPLFILYDPANNAAEVGRVALPPTYVQ